MQPLTFSGIDASNEISLLEYGLLVSDQKHEDNSGTQFCIYRQDADLFGTAHISENEINRMLSGEDWINEKDLKGFYSFIGENDRSEYLNTSFVNKIYDLMSYFGTENIFGLDYSPMQEKEAKERYLS
jgi:hypothetical protein